MVKITKRDGSGKIAKGNVNGMRGVSRPVHPNAVKTQFKKGEKPTALPLGTVRTDRDGYLKIKLREDGRDHRDRWFFVHRLVWQIHHGPIPKRHMVEFIDGDHGNVEISNLRLASREEHLQRYTVHNLPPKLKSAIQLLGQLKRRIRESQNRRPSRNSFRNTRRPSR